MVVIGHVHHADVHIADHAQGVVLQDVLVLTPGTDGMTIKTVW